MVDREPGATNFYKDSFKLDGRMTAGYAATIILSKSRTYAKSTYILYDWLQLTYELGGYIFLSWLWTLGLSKLAGTCMQNENSKLLSRVYRQNANQTIDEEKELKPTLNSQMAAIPAKPTLAERLAGGIRHRLHEILTQQINTINTVDGFNEKFREASNMSEDKVKDNHSLYLYLTSSMLRKPKFNSVSCTKMCRWRFSNQKRDKLKLRRFRKAGEILEKDLDVTTHLKSLQKLKGMQMTMLDDKQRMMLKYQHNRVIQLVSSDPSSENESEDSDERSNSKKPTSPEQKYKELMNSPQEVANLIYRRVIDSQGKITETDLRMLKGLSRTWVLE